jgi:uncharacterized membrane protein
MVMPFPFTGPRIDHERIVAAIRAAESRTSGEIRVVVTRSRVSNPVAEAKRQFERLGMNRTAARNGVLIYVAPLSRNFAVIGDTAVHEKCGDSFWRELAEAMTERFRNGEFEAGIGLGIETAGALLAEHFPIKPGDQNELTDDVEEV